MLIIDNVKYITDKEASYHFGFSQSWYKKRRALKNSPPYVRMQKKILYPFNELKEWFINHMKRIEDEN